MKNNFLAATIACMAVGWWAAGLSTLVQASPQLGGDCHYCHGLEQPDAMTLTGETEVIDEMQIFEVEPGGEVDFGIDVNNPGNPVFYRVVVRGLDRLDGADEHGTPHNLPRLYTPDETWQTKGPAGDQFMFWEGQFYGQGPAFAPSSFNYHLEISEDVEPGLYDLIAYVGGGFPVRAPGHTPQGGWSDVVDFQLRVVPEPSSVALLLAGGLVCCLGLWRRRRCVPIALVLIVCLWTADVGHAYPSRSGDCAVCHSIQGPNDQTGDFKITDAEGNETDSITVAAGDSTEFVLEFTQLVEDHLNPGTVRRGYMIVKGLDQLNVDQGPPPAFEDMPYAEALYTANVGEEDGQWHNGRYVSGAHRYIGSDGQYFALSSSDPNAVMPFPLALSPDVAPGDYKLTALLAGGRPTDEEYHNGWFVAKEFTLTVTAAANAMAVVPEPGSLALLVGAIPALVLVTRRRRRPA